MNWRSLFDEAAASQHEEQLRERLSEVADRTRRERATRTLMDRLAADWSRIEVVVSSQRVLVGDVGDVGADWFTIRASDRRNWLVPRHAVVQVASQGGRPAGTAPPSLRRMRIGYALRALARGRVAVIVDDVLGRSLTGTIEAVGSDAIDLAVHPVDQPPRHASPANRRVLAIGALSCVGGQAGHL
ncbi:MAG TPA: hypothetical protein VES01_07695 [Dermatophilaceae bacterium]|nr:hypothetical protein [Dermatophilaceae bacterium]